MKIYHPEYLNELGERNNNEDAIYPNDQIGDNSVFMVCDGVGGQAKGELASKLICEHLPEYLNKIKPEKINKDVIEKGLRYAESKLKDFANENPEAKDMASTLTIVCLSQKENSALLGWVGDSRIFHIRNGKILFQTKDHSEVQNLVDMGEISEEEAETHPRRNVITRSVNGKTTARMDHKKVKDIRENDYLLLCSDGILENLGKTEIKRWFKEAFSPEIIRNKILKNAKGKTKDNYSMVLIKIKEAKIAKMKSKWFWQKR